MRYIAIPNPPGIPPRWAIISKERTSALALIKTHKERSDYLKKHSSWGALKPWLSLISHGKCWYCEANCLRATSDVDHFRPKLGTTVNRLKINHDGYYWLAYKWENFRLSCQRCNRPEKDEDILHGKANEFALKIPNHRCNSEDDANNKIEDELPTLLDPCCKEDIALLAYTLDGEVKPAANSGTWEYQRAHYTIDALGFNDFGVPAYKKRRWLTIATLIRLAGKRGDRQAARKLMEHMDASHEYSSFFRSVIGTHRDKDWIEEVINKVD